MKRLIYFIIMIRVFLTTGINAQAPNVSNVTFSQRTDGSGIVDIYYDISDEDDDSLSIMMDVSDDGGYTWEFPSTQTSGDIGDDIPVGTGKHIIWNLGDEHPNTFNEHIVVKIIADENPLCIDYDGNIYHTVKIGNQEWMVENLKTTHYRNGAVIPSGSSWINISTGAYAVYDNNDINADTYGYLYNWYAVEDGRNIAPAGWHVPTDAEWTVLTNYLGTSAGSKLAGNATLWDYGSLESNADFGTSGFMALPGGYRGSSGGYNYIGTRGYFWSSTENSDNAYFLILDYNSSGVTSNYTDKNSGFSVRCVRD